MDRTGSIGRPLGRALVCILILAYANNQISANSLRISPSVKLQELTEHRLSRLKRQAYAVKERNSEMGISVDSGSEESGPWGPWTKDKDCSRTCGGGVLSETRQCRGKCTGPKRRYISCNLEACGEDAIDFRTEQCQEHKDKEVEGKYYDWKPATHGLGIKNRCELNCQPVGETFFMKFANKVVDGTKCDAISDDICVEGLCLPLGCDGKLGSPKKNDKCLACDGNGKDCKTVEGFFDERNLETRAYHDIVTLPEGATSIMIQERRATNNYLAIRNASDHWYLNGNWRIEMAQNIEMASTVFDYDRKKENGLAFEKLTAKGPLQEELTIALLYQSDSSTGIQYEYSMTLEEVQYIYKPAGEWSQCSVTCGKGVQTRELECIDQLLNQRVAETMCEENNASKPETEMECSTVDCDAEWFSGEWEECSHSCGDQGTQYRVVYCHQVFKNGKKITVDDEKCAELSERPHPMQNCNRFVCPDWNAGPWSSCSKKCGAASQYRSVTCLSAKPEEEGKLLPASACPEGKNPERTRACNLGPCEGLHFETSEWDLCAKCNDTTETRTVTCVDNDGRKYPLEKCEEFGEEKPEDERECETVVPCLYQWHTSEWNECSTDCGHGHQIRSVVCAIRELDGNLLVMDEMHCNMDDKPTDTQNCTQETACTGKFMAELWSECTESCGGGMQSRKVFCFTWDFKVDPRMCDELEKPLTERKCNEDPCPVCFDSDFGCCPDNTTFADGPFNEGCSNCTISEFGCCADNYTEASGPDGEGCLEFVEEVGSGDSSDSEESGSSDSDEGSQDCENSVWGCCGDGMTEMPENGTCPDILCDYTDGETTVTLSCVNETDDGPMLGNETTVMNETQTCAKSEFGCCPDWVTFAEGENSMGCPEFIMGECNGTTFGCCQDNVTLARGNDLQGCGMAGCSASVFGCCPDRRTIAFGPHYKGCERSSFPCEASEWGCCPDGETAALGTKGEGCGESCLLSKFGCCPDGVTSAEGDNNEGCGCRYAQYGCCPDGKSASEGPNFRGCPESCAQSSYGCCPDGKTVARGPNREGCPCQYTQYGCCDDGETAARGPNKAGCDDCRNKKYGCCRDGITSAMGPNQLGCPTTTAPPGPNVAKIVACTLPSMAGNLCGDYSVKWFFDADQSKCIQFWYAGCDGNDNRFDTQTECEATCINPPGYGVCYLDKNEGDPQCSKYALNFHYDFETQTCNQFYWRGCGGNGNRFESREACMATCRGVSVPGQPVRTTPRTQTRAPPRVTPVYPPESATRAPQTNPPRTAAPSQPKRPCSARPCGPGETCKDEWERCNSDSSGWCLVAICSRGRGGGGRGGSAATTARWTTRTRRTTRSVDVPTVSPGVTTYPKDPCVPNPCASDVLCKIDWQRCSTDPNGWCAMAMCDGRQVRTTRDLPGPGGISQAQYAVSVTMEKSTGGGGVTRNPGGRLPDEGLRGSSSGGGGNLVTPVGLPYAPSAPPAGGVIITEQGFPDPSLERTKGYGDCSADPCQPDEDCVPQSECTCPPRSQSPCPCIYTCFASRLSESDCRLPSDSGSCKAFVQQFYFDSYTGSCQSFLYGGCGGNVNRFGTRYECEQQCEAYGIGQGAVIPTTSAPAPPPPRRRRNVCKLPMVKGDCIGTFNMFYYEQGIGQCLPFVYSGCGGNRNRFPKLSDCEAECGRSKTANLETGPAEVQRRPSSEQEGLPQICLQERSRGRCTHPKSILIKWYYRASDGVCVKFYYSGCHGNENRFDTEEECLSSCGRQAYPCDLPRVVGPCQAMIPRYYYNKDMNRCDEFNYGGCLGNSNQFGTLAECEQRCIPSGGTAVMAISVGISKSENSPRQEAIRVAPENPEVEINVASEEEFEDLAIQGETEEENQIPEISREEICTLPMDAGPCVNHEQTAWFYDIVGRECVIFTYGGCEGNLNRFSSQRECENTCDGFKIEGHRLGGFEKPVEGLEPAVNEVGVRKISNPRQYPRPTSNLPELCMLQQEGGSCFGEDLHWFYNSETKECEGFMYTGCDGNANRFTSQEACLRACGRFRDQDVCTIKYDEGECDRTVQKWFYNGETGHCENFLWGGCGGNGNRFSSKEECMNLCTTETAPAIEEEESISTEAVCTLEMDAGPCQDAVSQWFFEKSSGECKLFTYGGCRGNGNRFQSQDECELRCRGEEKLGALAKSASTGFCSLPSESGHCKGHFPRFFYNPESGRCEDFVYGGCGGNENNFVDRANCETACLNAESEEPEKLQPIQHSPPPQEPQGTVTVTSEQTTYHEGMTITLTCASSNPKIRKFSWFKDGNKLVSDDKHVVSGPTLVVRLSETSDSGDYSCVPAQVMNAALSEPLTILVKENENIVVVEPTVKTEPLKICEDQNDKANCNLIVRGKLCDHKYYRELCCRSCTDLEMKKMTSSRNVPVK